MKSRGKGTELERNAPGRSDVQVMILGMAKTLRSLRVLVRRNWGLIAVTVAVLVFHGSTLMRYPHPFVDEAWSANRAWGFLQTGRAYGTLDSDFMVEYQGYGTFFPLLPVLAHASVLRLTPEPDLQSLRLLSLGFGLVLLGAVYTIVQCLFGSNYGSVSVVLTALSFPFLLSSHLARSDIMAAALGYAALAIQIIDRRRRFIVGLLAGLLVGLSFECHPNAAVFGPALLGVCLARDGLLTLRRPALWGIAVGGLLGILIYGALHIYPNPSTYAELMRLFFNETHTPPILTRSIHVLATSLAEMPEYLIQMTPLAALAAFGAVHLVVNKTDEGRVLLGACLGLSVGFVLLVRNKMAYYAIVLTPLYDMLATVLLMREFGRSWYGTVADYLRRGLAAGFAAGSVLLTLRSAQASAYPHYLAAQTGVNAVVSRDDTIVGSQIYWFGLHQHHYDSWEELVYYRRYKPDSTLADAFAYLRPDIVILDGYAWGFFRDEPGDTLYFQYLTVSNSEFERFLAQRAVLLTAFDNDVYGQIFVYRVLW